MEDKKEKLNTYLKGLNANDLWLLGEMINYNAEFCEDNIEEYQAARYGEDDWILERKGDWHEDNAVPLKAKTLNVIEAFQFIVRSSLFKLGEASGEREKWIETRTNLTTTMTEDQRNELKRVEPGFLQPIFLALPHPEFFEIKESGGVFSICLLELPLKYLDKIRFREIAEYILLSAFLEQYPAIFHESTEDLVI